MYSVITDTLSDRLSIPAVIVSQLSNVLRINFSHLVCYISQIKSIITCWYVLFNEINKIYAVVVPSKKFISGSFSTSIKRGTIFRATFTGLPDFLPEKPVEWNPKWFIHVFRYLFALIKMLCCTRKQQ